MSRLSYASRLPHALLGLCVIPLITMVAKADEANYARTLVSTVWILTSSADEQTATGTGVFIDAEKRLVLTNAHVVGDSRSAVVFFPEVVDGQPRVERKDYLNQVEKLAQRGKVVAIDRRRDLALIELAQVPERAKPIELADKSVTPGSHVDMIGNPGDSDVLWAYTSGTVRLVYDKKFKSDHGEHEFKVVETQSPIKPGESGGPIVNSQGKLVAIAQSFSPRLNLVSYCVDITEIKQFLSSPWKPAPLASKILLEQAGIAHETHSSGHYQVDRQLSTTATQSVFVAKETEYYRRAEVRRIWSLATVTKESPGAELMMRLMRQNAATKIGAWSVEKNASDEFMVLYVAKLDATAPDEALEGTIDYVARIAGAMAKELRPKQAEKSSDETLAAWLAD